MNANQVPVTTLQKHPSEECFATGDETGKIFLWRQFNSQWEVKTVSTQAMQQHIQNLFRLLYQTFQFYSLSIIGIILKSQALALPCLELISSVAAKKLC